MTKEVTQEQLRDTLLTALENEEYVQARGTMKIIADDDSCRFCIMGVVCDVWSRLTGKGYWEDRIFVVPNKHRSSIHPHQSILADFGFRDDTLTGSIKNGACIESSKYLYYSLMEASDASVTFPNLARFIRENPDKVWQ